MLAVPIAPRRTPRIRKLDRRDAPDDVIAAWPAHEPLAALVSAGAPARGARWTILARPGERLPNNGPDALGALAAPRAAPSGDPDAPPFVGGWIGWLSYDLGRSIEPAAQAAGARRARDDRAWPIVAMARCDDALVYDHARGLWWAVGDADVPAPVDRAARRRQRCRVSALRSVTGRERFIDGVSEVLRRIADGEVYQVNLAHRLTGAFQGSHRALFRRLLRAAAPDYGALLEGPTPGAAVFSISPELFLAFDPATRRVATRPIKGTRPATGDARELLASEKDGAELAMIVDLMRNDLGRVCAYGTVDVTQARAVERHGGAGRHARAGVLHAVAEVSGRLRAGATLADLLHATFPPGSVTGAPKIRAMRIIDELEPVRRGPYCGAAGFVSDCGRACLSVAIRTGAVTGEPLQGTDGRARFDALRGAIDYTVGAGVVADSDPEGEWRETLDKAALFRRIVRARRRRGAGAGV